MGGLLGAATTGSGAKAPVSAGIPDFWARLAGGGAPEPQSQEPSGVGGGTPTLQDLYREVPGPMPGPELDPQMSEVAPPKLPDMARAGLMAASAGSAGGAWQAQPVQQMGTGDIGKRIYPPGGTALTGKRVY